MTKLHLAVAVVAAIALSGCYRNAVVGDSLSWGARDIVESPDTRVEGSVGRGIVIPGGFLGNGAETDGLSALAALAPRVVNGWLVIQLGTNDVSGPRSLLQSSADIATALAQLEPRQCVAWVLPWNGRHPAASAAFGEVVRANLALRTCSAEIDWPAVVARDPEVLRDDLIHLTQHGNRMLAAEIAQVIARPTTPAGPTPSSG